MSDLQFGTSMLKRILFLLLVIIVGGLGGWALVHFGIPKWQSRHQSASVSNSPSTNADPWTIAIEKVKADRGEPMGANAAVSTPPELRHYSDRHWFLATQVAEIAQHDIYTCQDFVDLAALIERGEIVPISAVTDTYLLFGVGEEADQRPFTRYQDERSIEIYNEAQLNDAYKQLDKKRSGLNAEIASLKAQLGKLNRRERSKQKEIQEQISARQRELNSADEEKALLDKNYGRPDTRQKMLREYESLRTFASNFGGRSYNLEVRSDRQTLKVNMLSALRPQALKILEQVASAYHRHFDRPLPVSSLVRPEEYQRMLRRVNRNAVLIETPPHSTGLAFDIDFRYMSAAEQTFLMSELARLKNEGRIEVIRESNANYHVFAFIDGARPSDDLIAASIEEAKAPVQAAHHTSRKAANVKSKSKRAGTAKARRSSASVRRRRR